MGLFDPLQCKGFRFFLVPDHFVGEYVSSGILVIQLLLCTYFLISLLASALNSFQKLRLKRLTLSEIFLTEKSQFLMSYVYKISCLPLAQAEDSKVAVFRNGESHPAPFPKLETHE